ncbi:MAG: DUF4011 domain-containing protein, partial [Hyphomicrobiales bacterium]|nr:DUF4011 domain-containing protein [Hyphomicrobiales bacterium]
MKFWATGTDKKPEVGNDSGDESGQFVQLNQTSTQPNEPDEERYTDDRLETRLGPDGLQKRLLKMFRDAKTAEEEQGINILYLALGFLKWFEDTNSSVEREAPLILLPVDLIRNKRTSTYDIVMRDDEIVTNLPIKEKLRRELGISLPEIDSPDSDEWTPSAYFDLVEDAISSKDRWSIDRDGIQLGFFSFAKLLMLRDLDPENWPSGGLLNSTILSSLLNSTFAADSPIFCDEDNLDEKLDPADIFHVLDADRSQAIVIEEVRKGRNLVVQGPPGTGKSQTITNIIAAGAQDGKKVLFVAEKMAALSVVHDRLKRTGLEHLALELHSKAANKRRVLEELKRTLNESAIFADAKDNPDIVRIPRDNLNSIVRQLHTRIDGCALSPFQAIAIMSAMKGKGAPAPSIDAQKLIVLPDDRIEDLCNDVCALSTLITTDKTSYENPFRGARNTGLQPPELDRLSLEAKEVRKRADDLSQRIDRFRSALGFPNNNIATAKRVCEVFEYTSKSSADWDGMIPLLFDIADKQPFNSSIGCAVAWTQAQENSSFKKAATSIQAGEMRAALCAGLGSFFGRLSSRYRSASKSLATLIHDELPKQAAGRVTLVDRLIEFQSLNERFRQSLPILQDHLGQLWAGEATDFKTIRDTSEFIQGFRTIAPNAPVKTLSVFLANNEQIAKLAEHNTTQIESLHTRIKRISDKLDIDFAEAFSAEDIEHANLKEIAERFGKIEAEQHRYDKWRRYCELRNNFADYNLDNLASRMETGTVRDDSAIDEIKYAQAEATWKISRDAQPTLSSLGDLQRHELVEQFKKAELDRMETVRKIIASDQLKRVPSGAIGEMGYVRSQIARKRGHDPIRKLMHSAGSVIQRIRPVFLMSPISIAQFL